MYLDSGRYVVNFEIGSCESSKFILLFKNCLIYFGSLAFINFCKVRWDFESQWVSSVTQSCLALCDPMDCSMPGFPVHHQLLEPIQTHARCINDAIQPSHPLLSPSPASNLSQHQGLFQWIGSSHQVAKVLEFQLQHQSFPMNIQGWFPLGLTGLVSSLSRGLSRDFSSTTIWKHQFFSAKPSLWSNSHICTWLLEKP